MLDARPGFIVKFLKRSLIVNLLKHELSTASLQSSTGKVIKITLPVEDCRLAVESSCFNKFTIRERFREIDNQMTSSMTNHKE